MLSEVRDEVYGLWLREKLVSRSARTLRYSSAVDNFSSGYQEIRDLSWSVADQTLDYRSSQMAFRGLAARLWSGQQFILFHWYDSRIGLSKSADETPCLWGRKKQLGPAFIERRKVSLSRLLRCWGKTWKSSGPALNIVGWTCGAGCVWW